MKQEKKEKDLNVLDLWKAPSGNLFLKINESYSIALGTLESFKTFHQKIQI